MKKTKILIGPGLILSVFILSGLVSAQEPPAAQTAGGVILQEKQSGSQEALKKRLGKEKAVASGVESKDVILQDKGPKTLVSKIVVEGAVLLSEKEIQNIIVPYEGKEISFQTMQKIADLLTDEFRKKGYVTSRAYVPPQTIRDSILIIRVVEGKVGAIEVKGNRYFSSSLLRGKIGLEPAGYFDYSALQKSLVYINEHPDRMAKAILVPGKEAGTTDIVIEVEDRAPFHAGFSYDNYGSRYIEKNRYALTLEHNNVSGHDDKIYVKAQVSDGERLVAQQGRYLYPITPRFELGGHLLFSQLALGKEFEDLNSQGDASIFGVFSNYTVIEKNDLEMRLNLGFDSKNITNELAGAQLSRDELRVFKTGMDLDLDDRWGRTILTAGLDTGIPDFLGAMSAKDPDASRVGAGGKFTKGVFNLFRLQPMAFSSSLLFKNSFQLSNNALAASEQFQIGGATSVRGYAPGEYSGDEGFYSAVEWSMPFYGLSKDLRIPFRKEKLYDALRFVFFWDIGMVHLNNAQVGESENETLRSAGFGGRLTVSEALECRVEVGYPLGGKSPSDGDTAHTWVEFHWKI